MSTTDPDVLATVYSRLRGMADRQLASERDEHTLQPTALVHEAWLSLRDRLDGMRDDPGRFFGAAAEAMRCILIDHARRRATQKRGGDAKKVSLDNVSLDLVALANTAGVEDLVALDEAIRELESSSPRSAEVVRLRFYAGLDERQVAELLEMSIRTARREWAFARAFLFKKLRDATQA